MKGANRRRCIPIGVALFLGIGLAIALFGLDVRAEVSQAAGDDTKSAGKKDDGAAAKSAGGKSKADELKEKLVALKLDLPKPAFKGTPKHVPPGTNLEKPRHGRRKALMVRPGCVNVAKGKPVISSDGDPIQGTLDMITDGDKEAFDYNVVEISYGSQNVTIDLGKEHEIEAILLWHFHGQARVYHDVIVEISSDKDFAKGVKTVFNNDHDNSSGKGVGKQKEYWEVFEGKLIPVSRVKGRYVRLWSKGNTDDDQNHYTEVEVFAVPKKK